MSTLSEPLQHALASHRAGKFAVAEQAYRKVLAADPHQPDALHWLGILASQCGRAAEAIGWLERAVAAAGSRPGFHNNLAAAYLEQGRPRDAEAACRRALELAPEYADATFNLARALEDLNDDEAAEESYRRALQLRPELTGAWLNLGNLIGRDGRFGEAEGALRRATEIEPYSAEAWFNLGNLLVAQGRRGDALACYQCSVEFDPHLIQARCNLATLLVESGKLDEAERHFRRAKQLAPDKIEAISGLAQVLEKLNRRDEAACVASEALSLDPRDPLANLVSAWCKAHEGHHQQAVDQLLAIEPYLGDNPGMRKVYAYGLGQFYDRLNRPEEAFPRFTEANRLAGDEAGPALEDRQAYLDELAVLARTFTPDWIASWTPTPAMPEEQLPVFLVGFPRSGTTLLDQILDSHPKLQTLSEQPALLNVLESLDELPGGYPRALANLKATEIERLRQIYFATVGECIDRRPGRVLIDKLPLNSVRVGLILRVFPNARFIVAIRHPCDVCLSCFMQEFKPNAAMANFLDLRNTATFYAQVMNLWRQYVDVLPHRHHLVRYEDLVGDFDTETGRLLDFLGVGWDEAVRRFAEHALNRGLIRTPSYHQVTRPIYREARYRWQRYAAQLAEIVPMLRPFIERFGYRLDASVGPAG